MRKPFPETSAFSAKLTEALKYNRIFERCRNLHMDHACIRFDTVEKAVQLRVALIEYGQEISAVQVNGREIAIVELREPLQISEWNTTGIEIPFPKPNHLYENGWEHVEFVLPGAEATMESLRKDFLAMFPKFEATKYRDQFSYSEDEPHANADQLPNPTIGINMNGVGIKFHPHSIQEVVGHQK